MSGEVESQLHANGADEQIRNNNLFTSLGRQSSIYSLTLDEFQHTLCENGKNFGSMNMDEFLSSIWSAEENQATNINNPTSLQPNHTMLVNDHVAVTNNNNNNEKGKIAKQLSLSRQGSLTLPAPLCRKTVDEVWSEIRKGHKPNTNDVVQNSSYVPTNTAQPENANQQSTFGEMTLEDFLVKAGVVREQMPTPQPHVGVSPPPQYGVGGTSYVNRPLMGAANGSSRTTVPTFPIVPPSAGGGGSVMVEPSVYTGEGKKIGYSRPAPPPPVQPIPVYGGRAGQPMVVTAAQPMVVVAAGPVSPVSSDGMCGSQLDNPSGGQFGMEMGGFRGRKRIIDGPVEKVVERRQRRMIKNRESAARSRARKQAYTVELEAELNQLKEENAQLKQALAELERKRRQQVQYSEEFKYKVQSKAQKAKERLRMMKRSSSSPM
ncbi:hypothetical protein ACFE04_020186 [Oxalis oulophora]